MRYMKFFRIFKQKLVADLRRVLCENKLHHVQHHEEILLCLLVLPVVIMKPRSVVIFAQRLGIAEAFC